MSDNIEITASGLLEHVLEQSTIEGAQQVIAPPNSRLLIDQGIEELERKLARAKREKKKQQEIARRAKDRELEQELPVYVPPKDSVDARGFLRDLVDVGEVWASMSVQQMPRKVHSTARMPDRKQKFRSTLLAHITKTKAVRGECAIPTAMSRAVSFYNQHHHRAPTWVHTNKNRYVTGQRAYAYMMLVAQAPDGTNIFIVAHATKSELGID